MQTHQKIRFSPVDGRVILENPGTELARLSLLSMPLTWAQLFIGTFEAIDGTLSLELALEAEPDGSRVRLRAVEPLALQTVTLRQGTRVLLDRADLSLRPSVDWSASRIIIDLADLSFSTPGGDRLGGRLSAEVAAPFATPVTTFSVQLDAIAVDAVKPHLSFDPSPLKLTLNASGRHEGRSMEFEKMSLVANRGEALLAAVETAQRVRLDLDTSGLTTAQPGAPTARLRLGTIPLAWADSFVTGATFAGTLEGGAFEVAFRNPADLTIKTSQPVPFRGLGYSADGKPVVQALDGTADFTLTRKGDVLSYEVRRLELGQGDTAIGTLNVSGEMRLGSKTDVSAKGNLEVDVARLMQQPALLPSAALSRGRITAAFDGAVADSSRVKAALFARSLVARADNRALGDVDLTLTGNLKSDGSGAVSLPLKLAVAGRKSDLLIEGTFGRSTEKLLFKGKVSGQQVIVEDIEPLAALVPGSEAPKAAAGAPKFDRDERAFWHGLNGKVQAEIQKVIYGKDEAIAGLRGTVTLLDERLALESLEGRFKENPFKASAAITFNARAPKPYTLAGSADVTNLDLGAMLRASNPNERPAIESKVTVRANLKGSGANVGDLMSGIYGEFDASGTPGVLRALGKKGQTASTVSSLLGIVGAMRGSETTLALAELTATLNELRFDSFKMKVTRSADLSLKVSDLEIVSPTMRTTGSGGIAPRGSEPLPDQPMRFELQLAAKDQLAVLLNKAGALSGKQDDKGYYLMAQSFAIVGTPAKPDSSQLWQIFTLTAARAAAGALFR